MRGIFVKGNDISSAFVGYEAEQLIYNEYDFYSFVEFWQTFGEQKEVMNNANHNQKQEHS